MIIELMKEALQAMERRNAVKDEEKVYLQNGIQSLREAIAMAEFATPDFITRQEKAVALLQEAHKLFTSLSFYHPSRWAGLTTNDINNLYTKTYKSLQNRATFADYKIIVRAVEAELQDRNT